jgi:hypothetical protein
MDIQNTSFQKREQIILDMIENRGGLRCISVPDALTIYNCFEKSDVYIVYGPFDSMKTLHHIVYPTRTFNFWDIYVSCVRDLTMNDFTIDVVSCPNMQIKICYDDIMDVRVAYKDMYYDFMGEIRYRWNIGENGREHTACINNYDGLKRFVLDTQKKKENGQGADTAVAPSTIPCSIF